MASKSQRGNSEPTVPNEQAAAPPSEKRIEIEGAPYSYGASQAGKLGEIADRVKSLRESGSLGPEVLGRIRKYFRIKNIYHSSAIEGNQLTVGETKLVVERGLTITGKSLKDQAEAKNLSEALDFLEQLVSDTETPISERDVRELHRFVLKGIDDDNAGKYRTVAVKISGSGFDPPSPESVPPEMRDFGDWLKKMSVGIDRTDPMRGILTAAAAHAWFVYIHPFIDGNGRVARLLMNLVLMRYGCPVAIITKEDRIRYYDALEESQSSDISSFLALIIENLYESLEEYEAAAEQQRENEEWAASIAASFSERERVQAGNEYEVWKNAMELLKSYFAQAAQSIDEANPAGRIWVKDFGQLEFEKYLGLRNRKSTTRTWFFRIDFKSSGKTARYLFFFGSPSWKFKADADVTLHIAREDPAGSFHYERLDVISKSQSNVPNMVEIGYEPKTEKFIEKSHSGSSRTGKIDDICKRFFEDVMQKHFQT